MEMIRKIMDRISDRFQRVPSVEPSQVRMQLDPTFVTEKDLIVEFGVGKGLFIRNYAAKYPDKNFLGVEKYQKWTRHAFQRIEKNGLTNVRLMQATGEEVVTLLSSHSVREYYILFPDPWPKRRHQQRRIIQTSMIERIHFTLKTGGRLYIATDHADYYQWMQKIIQPFLKHHFKSIQYVRPEFISNYQVKYEKEGRPIYTIHVEKI